MFIINLYRIKINYNAINDRLTIDDIIGQLIKENKTPFEEKLNPYFDEFPGLKEDIFKASNDEYYAIEKENLEEFIKNHKSNYEE